MQSRVWSVLFVCSAIAAAGCTTELPTSHETKLAPEIANVCPDVCNDVDPFPNAVGIFAGDVITASYCFAASGDLDMDGVVDYCEERLSDLFRPELKHSGQHDDVRREPYWVVRPDSNGHLMIGYLFSYYKDNGTYQWGCSSPYIPYGDSACHNGDSEAIFLVVDYDAPTHHWILRTALYTQHTGYVSSTLTAGGYANVEYPTHAGGYPRVWVGEGKHASHFFRGDGGSLFSSTGCNYANYHWTLTGYIYDWCGRDDYVSTRLEWSGWWNIGSQQHPFHNGTVSRNPSYEYYGQGGYECYWYNLNFRGWVPESVGGGDAGSSQLTKLIAFGFSTPSGNASGCIPPPPPPPGGGGQNGFTVSVSGPVNVQPYSACLFQALPQGGAGSYSFAWTQDGSPVGDDSPYYRANAGTIGYVLAVTVTDANSGTAYGSQSVAVDQNAQTCNDQ